MIGYISKEYTVWCGKCCKWEQQSTVRKVLAEKQFRKNGWRKMQELGWVCPECLTKN